MIYQYMSLALTPRTPEAKAAREAYLARLEMQSKPFRGAPISPRSTRKYTVTSYNSMNSNAENNKKCFGKNCLKRVKNRFLTAIGRKKGGRKTRSRKTRSR
jgi:hypothetical protein